MSPLNRRRFTSRFAIGALTSASLASGRALAKDEQQGWIDAHVHVWTPDIQKYPLAPGFTPEAMQPPSFTASELLSHCQSVGVDRVVLIQMNFYGYDHSYLFDVMREHPGTFSAVAQIDDRADDVAEQAKQLVQQGARGFRIYSPDGTSRWCDSDSMQRLWQAAAEENFAICPLINPQDIQYVDVLCQRFPETTVVVDHFARIGISGDIEEDRLNKLVKLARFPKVYVKTSAFYALGKKQPPYHDLKPMIRRLLDAFGPQRLMWATDCPYQVQGEHSYRASIDLILDETSFLSATDKQWILRDTAHKVFFS